MTSSKDSTSGAQSNPKAIHHHLEIIKKLKPAVLEDFLITSRWLSLSRLLKLKDLSQGEHEQLLSLLLSLDATQNERLIREVTELLLSQDVSSDKETLDEDHLTSTTITLIGEGEGALDLHVDHLPDHLQRKEWRRWDNLWQRRSSMNMALITLPERPSAQVTRGPLAFKEGLRRQRT